MITRRGLFQTVVGAIGGVWAGKASAKEDHHCVCRYEVGWRTKWEDSYNKVRLFYKKSALNLYGKYRQSGYTTYVRTLDGLPLSDGLSSIWYSPSKNLDA